MDPIQKIRDGLRNLLVSALEKSRAEGLITFDCLPDFVIEVPRDEGHGDFSSNVAMLMARSARMAPRKIAEIIVGQIDRKLMAELQNIEIAGAGFINFFSISHGFITCPRW